MRSASLLLALALVGCVKPTPTNPARAPAPPPNDISPAPSPSPALANAAEDFWAELIRYSPIFATGVGDHTHDSELDDLSLAAARTHVDKLFSLRVRLDSIDPDELSATERATLDALRETLDGRLEAANACASWTWQIDPLDGPAIHLMQLPVYQVIKTKEDAAALGARYRASKPFFEGHIKALRAGLDKGAVAPAPVVKRMIASLDGALAVPAADSPMAKAKLPDSAPGWHMEEVVRVRKTLVKAVEEGAYPGLTLYRDFLKSEVLPKAREEKPGADGLPGGAACYQAMIRRETGTTRTPKNLHDLGLAQVASLEAEMEALAKAGGAKDRVSYEKALMAKPSERFDSREAMVAHAKAWVAKAERATGKAFHTFPKTPLEVRVVEPWRENDAPSAYDMAPADLSRNAIFWVNAVGFAEEGRYGLAALSAHEAIPGHHFQIALAQENKALPRFQRDLPPNAYVEGWALYAERLADELALYSPEERLGMLDGQRYRAVRLVVDTGLHALGWSREKAIAYQIAHAGSERAGAERAIDRYLTWPGQALGYTVGMIEIQEIRAGAEKTLGKKFDLAGFHDVVLANGGVPLPVVRREVDAWVKSR